MRQKKTERLNLRCTLAVKLMVEQLAAHHGKTEPDAVALAISKAWESMKRKKKQVEAANGN